MTPKTDPLMIPTMRAWWSNHEDVRRWAGDVPSFPESPLNRIDDTLDEQFEQKWNVWKRTETHNEALLCGETERLKLRFSSGRTFLRNQLAKCSERYRHEWT